MGWISKRAMESKGYFGGKSYQRRGPLRKIEVVMRHSTGMFDASWVRLECGHETSSNGIYKARCVECAKEPNP